MVPIGRTKEQVIGPAVPDKIKDSSHHVLETGMIFYYFIELVKSSDRNRLLGLANDDAAAEISKFKSQVPTRAVATARATVLLAANSGSVSSSAGLFCKHQRSC